MSIAAPGAPLKRAHDDNTSQLTLQSYGLGRGIAGKRVRFGPGSPPQTGGLCHNVSLRARYPPNPDSPFNFCVPQEPLETHLDRAMLRHCRQRAGEHAKASGRGAEGPNEFLFSLDDVRTLVARALDERERKVSAAFDAVLQERLEAQYQSFAKFNACNIKRQLRESPYDYMC